MKRSVSLPVFIVSVLAALAVGGLGAVLGYVYFVGGSGEATRDVEAVPIAPGAEDTSAAQTFTILPEESEISFKLEEDLMGARTTVIGTSNQVTGNIAVNFDDPTTSMVGPIEINLRTLATNNEFRNRAIRDQILESNQDRYEFTTFTPTAVAGLPEAVAVGDTFTFSLTGNLPIREITREVVWEVTVTVVSETRLEGIAITQVTRSDYELVIPNVPSVANVTDEVDLKIEFVAIAD